MVYLITRPTLKDGQQSHEELFAFVAKDDEKARKEFELYNRLHATYAEVSSLVKLHDFDIAFVA